MRKPLQIVLLSPKGPLYRHRGGIFGRSLRYAPLTLPTLASLIPAELPVELRLIDEGIQDVDLELDADLVAMTVITGTAPRAYELAAAFRRRGVTVVLGGPHITLAPDDAQPHADAIVVGYAEETWPQLLRDFSAGRIAHRYEQAPGLSLANRPFPRRDLHAKRRYLTTNVFEATRGCVHNCDFCVVPSAWGRKPYQKPVADVIADIIQYGREETHLCRFESNRRPPVCNGAVYCPDTTEAPVVRTGDGVDCCRRRIARLGRSKWVQGPVDWFGIGSTENLRQSHKAFNIPANYRNVVDALHARRIALQGCFVFGLDHDTPDVFLETARFAVDAGIDLPRFAIVTPFPGTALFAGSKLRIGY